MEAARTCSRLLTPSVHLISGHGHVVSQTAVQVVADVLSKLLVVGITDPDPDIRYCVLASLDERFDAHLAQAENLQALFVALNDEVFEIRELAICTIGRLSSMNPAFVMPFLRKMLIQHAMKAKVLVNRTSEECILVLLYEVQLECDLLSRNGSKKQLRVNHITVGLESRVGQTRVRVGSGWDALQRVDVDSMGLMACFHTVRILYFPEFRRMRGDLLETYIILTGLAEQARRAEWPTVAPVFYVA
eukprot:g41255.t1